MRYQKSPNEKKNKNTKSIDQRGENLLSPKKVILKSIKKKKRNSKEKEKKAKKK